MYERAKYFRTKFIRNGIAGFAMSALLIYYTIKGEALNPSVVIIPVAALLWLYFGLRINNKLKAKDEANRSSEIPEEGIPFKQVESILSVLVIIIIFLSITHWKYADYLAIPMLITYCWWLYSQMKLLNNYFRA